MVTEIQPERDRYQPSWRGGADPHSAPTQMVVGLLIMGVGLVLVLGRLGILERVTRVAPPLAAACSSALGWGSC